MMFPHIFQVSNLSIFLGVATYPNLRASQEKKKFLAPWAPGKPHDWKGCGGLGQPLVESWLLVVSKEALAEKMGKLDQIRCLDYINWLVVWNILFFHSLGISIPTD